MPQDPIERPDAPRRGPVSRALIGLFMKQAVVVGTEALNPDFYSITLRSPAFVGTAWTPGQKLQIAISGSLSARTYTPMQWDAIRGETRILAYAHGPGPGAAWARGVQAGDSCDVLGPRASLDVTALPGPVVVIGDETAFGLAIAMAGQNRARPAHYLFEVNATDRARTALQRFALNEAELYHRTPGDAHLTDIEARLQQLATPGTSWILTGQAGTIQRLRRFLKTTAPVRIMTKAYWAPGKTGLD